MILKKIEDFVDMMMASDDFILPKDVYMVAP